MLVAGTAWAQPPRVGPRRPLRGKLPTVVATAPLRRGMTAGTSYDECLVRAPELDPHFAVPAREVGDAMAVPSRVAGLYRGTLAPRR
jgi:hypothetical protein